MRAWKQTCQRDVDGGSVLTCLAEWAAQFYDDSSPARVTDVLVAFAFVAGLNFAAAGPATTAALLCGGEEERPSASRRARLLARALLDSMAEKRREDHGPSPAVFEPSPSPSGGLPRTRGAGVTEGDAFAPRLAEAVWGDFGPAVYGQGR
jgi:hypothetical protein